MRKLISYSILFFILTAAVGQAAEITDLARLLPGKTYAQNALWIENPIGARFNSSKRVVVADVTGPAVITMIHFAMPQVLKLNRDLLLKIYWDGETAPSVDCPLVDFFGDPAGIRDELNTAMVNKQRGYNAYFPMPFRRSAKIELVYDGTVEPGEELWKIMPCYSYVMVRTDQEITEDLGYFHAYWRQEGLLLGKQDYWAMEAKGKGKFIGWNFTVRQPGRPGYPVDENAKFYVDGEETPCVELQGIEDSVGFSWGFPPKDLLNPYTGYFKYFQGAAAYRFFLNDSISFNKSLRVMIGFGQNEDPMFRREFSKPGNRLQLSTTCYWYQQEPHTALAALPTALERTPAPENPMWPEEEKLPSDKELRDRGVKLEMLCGRPKQEVIFAEPGYSAAVSKGYSWAGFPPPVYHCRAADDNLILELNVPQKSHGTLRIYIIDADNFQGGRKQEMWINEKSLGRFEKFTEGRWLECPIDETQTADGKIKIRAQNLRQEANSVISIIEFIDK